MFFPHPRVKVSIVGSLRDREVACSASDRQASNFESCVWRTVSSQSSHHPQEVLLAQFSLYVQKGGLKPDSFHFYHAINIGNETCVYCIYRVDLYNILIAYAPRIIRLIFLAHNFKRWAIVLSITLEVELRISTPTPKALVLILSQLLPLCF